MARSLEIGAGGDGHPDAGNQDSHPEPGWLPSRYAGHQPFFAGAAAFAK
jgi:hypothetical protein